MTNEIADVLNKEIEILHARKSKIHNDLFNNQNIIKPTYHDVIKAGKELELLQTRINTIENIIYNSGNWTL